MKILNLSLFLSILLFSQCKSQEKTSLSDKELQNLVEQEKRNENRAKYGNSGKEIVIISDSKAVNKLLAQYEEIQERKRAEKAAKLKDKSLSERYKEGDKSIVPQIIKVLKGSDAKEKRQLYSGLSRNFDEPEEYIITDPELIKTILDNINNPEDESAVIQLAGYMKLPGYLQIFENHLLSGKAKNIGRLVFWLGQEGTSNKAVDYVSKLILESKINLQEEYWIMSGLENFAKVGNDNIKKKTFDLCFEIYKRKLVPKEKFEEMKSSWSSDNPAQGLTSILLDLGDKQIIPIAHDLINKGICIDKALNTLIHLEGEKHKPLVMDNLNNKDNFYNALTPAITLYRITRDEAIIRSVLTNFEKRGDLQDFSYQRIVSTLSDMGASEYLEDPGKIIKKEEVASSLKRFYELTKGKVEDVANDLFNLGVIDRPFSKEIIDKAKKQSEQEEGSGGYISSLLNVSGIYHWFDAETGFVPADYDELMVSLSKNSNGKFENIKIWMVANEKQDNTYNYFLFLYANNKVYFANPEDIGDWYEVETVLALMNTALRDSGLKERYVFIETGDQTVQVMFGPEDKIKLFAEKYKL